MKNKRGITLVALVITIIILLILAGITISQLTENGLITKIIEAKEKQKNSEEYENNIINQYIQDIENINQPDVDVNDPSFIKYGLIQKISKISKSGYSNLEIEGTINEVVEKINYNIKF